MLPLNYAILDYHSITSLFSL